MSFPQQSDIWEDDDGERYLFLTEPSWTEDYISVTYLHLNTGKTSFGTFQIDPKTSTLYEWYRKIA